MKYKYWHIITEVGKDCPEMKAGMFATHHHIHDGYWVSLWDSKKGKELSHTYKLAYLGRLDKDLLPKIVGDRLRELAIKKGFEKLVA